MLIYNILSDFSSYVCLFINPNKTMKKFTCNTFLILIAIGSFAQSAFTSLDINNIRARIQSNGYHFMDISFAPRFEVPKDSGKHTIFAQALWIGGMDSQANLYLSAQTFNTLNSDFIEGPLSVDGLLTTDQQTIDAYRRIWLITSQEIQDHIQWSNNPSSMPGYIIPTDILEWPAHGDLTKNQSYHLAPFADMNGNGVYEPHHGDYPLIRGDMCAFFIFNDAGIPNAVTGGTPLGIEVHAMAYSFDCPQSYAFDHTIFMYYKIFNRSNIDYHDTYIGLYADFDIGYPWDDFIGCDVERGSMFAYNANPIDGTGSSGHYGMNPPAQSLTILGGPFMNPDGIDNPQFNMVVIGNDTTYVQRCDESMNGLNFGNDIIDDERLGMRRFIFINNALNAPWYMTEPSIAAEFYNFLRGIWKDGTKMLYGGNAHLNSGAYGPECDFMFPGDSDPCNWGTGGQLPNGPVYWTEGTSGNVGYDRRSLASSGPFTFTSGSAHMLDYALVYGRGNSGVQSSIDAMKANIDVIRSSFISNLNPCGVSIINSADMPILKNTFQFRVYPNPTNDELFIETDFSHQYKVQILNPVGKIVAEYFSDDARLQINVRNLATGFYLLVIHSDNAIHTAKFVKQY
jgi:hypothetical protein